jgi:hypothetical protein
MSRYLIQKINKLNSKMRQTTKKSYKIFILYLLEVRSKAREVENLRPLKII